jgi:anti-anti-sigma factor
MSLELPPTTGTVLSVDGSFADGVIKVRFAGTADVEAKPDLDASVKKLQEESLRLAATKVVIDFRELEFMNSSCFKVFVSWLAALQEIAPEKQYRIHLLSNPNLHWQRRSLAALSCFAVDLVTIET